MKVIAKRGETVGRREFLVETKSNPAMARVFDERETDWVGREMPVGSFAARGGFEAYSAEWPNDAIPGSRLVRKG